MTRDKRRERSKFPRYRHLLSLMRNTRTHTCLQVLPRDTSGNEPGHPGLQRVRLSCRAPEPLASASAPPVLEPKDYAPAARCVGRGSGSTAGTPTRPFAGGGAQEVGSPAPPPWLSISGPHLGQSIWVRLHGHLAPKARLSSVGLPPLIGLTAGNGRGGIPCAVSRRCSAKAWCSALGFWQPANVRLRRAFTARAEELPPNG
eukprot:SAG11_NODE_9312_length_923_cov_1.435680_2_plen_202_part_00